MNVNITPYFARQDLQYSISSRNEQMSSASSVDFNFKTSSSTLQTNHNKNNERENKFEDSTFKKTESITSTRQTIDINDTDSAIHTIAAYKVEKEVSRRKKLVFQLTEELEEALSLYTFAVDEYSLVEEKIIEIERKYSFVLLGEIVQAIYIRHFDKPKYLIGICEALLRYDLEEVSPWALVMLPGLLNHTDETVKEHAVLLIDNWESVALLPILRTLEINSAWLQDYVDSVIKELQDENVLHKKAV